MKVRWLLRAVLDLECLQAHIAEDDPDVAYQVVESVLVSVLRLEEFPGSGRPGRVPDTRELIVSSYIVAYRVKEDSVQILRVLHAARQWPPSM